MNDLWPSFDGTDIEKNNSLAILQAQANALEKKTDGKVKAKLSLTKYKKVNTNSFGEILSAAGRNLVSYENVEVFESELENKKDANMYFSNEEYKFEIYNDEFRFRIFKVNYNILYPISLTIDAGIAKELNNMVSIQLIRSDSALEDLLEKIFNTKKLYTIVSELMLKK